MTRSNANINPIIDLKFDYNMQIEVIPAWHDELIDKHSSIGLVFHLFDNAQSNYPSIKIGVTGDTEAYDELELNYKDVDILIAHLGDIKLRELLAKLDGDHRIMNDFIKKWCKIKGLDQHELKTKFMDYLTLQDLYGIDKKYLDDDAPNLSIKEQFRKLLRQDKMNDIMRMFNYYYLPSKPYKYKNHLGVTGIFNLYKSLLSPSSDQPANQHRKLMIIGELPEELQSYRHILACIMEEHKIEGGYQGRCFTGDIGLTVGLPTKGVKYGRPDASQSPNFSIRCFKCFQNNEYIEGLRIKNDNHLYLPHYHPIDKIQETCLKACSSRIVWLCHDIHARTPIFSGQEFLIAPDLRAVW